MRRGLRRDVLRGSRNRLLSGDSGNLATSEPVFQDRAVHGPAG